MSLRRLVKASVAGGASKLLYLNGYTLPTTGGGGTPTPPSGDAARWMLDGSNMLQMVTIETVDASNEYQVGEVQRLGADFSIPAFRQVIPGGYYSDQSGQSKSEIDLPHPFRVRASTSFDGSATTIQHTFGGQPEKIIYPGDWGAVPDPITPPTGQSVTSVQRLRLYTRVPYFRGAFAATTAYGMFDMVVEPGGALVTAKADFTSGASYSASDWNTNPMAGVKLTTSLIPAGTYRGDWQGLTAYAVGDLVSNAGTLYIVTKAYTSSGTFIATNLSTAYGLRPVGYRSNIFNFGLGLAAGNFQPGARNGNNQASALALLNGGAFTNNASYYCGPVATVVQGWDGRAVGLARADSTTFRQNGVSQFVVGMEDKTAGRKRLPLGNYAVPGTRPSNSADRLEGNWRRKYEAFDALRALNAAAGVMDPNAPGKGAVPFTFIWNNLSRNQSGSSEAFQKAYLDAMWANDAVEFPGIPVIQEPMSPRAFDRTYPAYGGTTEDHFYSDKDHQLLETAPLLLRRKNVDVYMRTAPDRGQVAAVAQLVRWGNPALAADDDWKWWVPAELGAPEKTTVVGDHLSTDLTLIVADFIPPGLGLAPLMLRPGDPGGVVKSCVASGGSWAITLDSSVRYPYDIPNGTEMRTALTWDGLHQLPWLSQYAGINWVSPLKSSLAWLNAT